MPDPETETYWNLNIQQIEYPQGIYILFSETQLTVSNLAPSIKPHQRTLAFILIKNNFQLSYRVIDS